MKNRTAEIIDFTIVYNRHKSKLYNYVLRMTSNVTICEDIVQNVFLKFYENLTALRDPESARYWLFTTARNEVYGYYRDKKVKRDRYGAADIEEVELTSPADSGDELEKKELRELIFEELDSIPPEQKEVYILKEYSELSYKEIADVLSVDENLVKGRLYKVRQKLIKKISKLI